MFISLLVTPNFKYIWLLQKESPRGIMWNKSPEKNLENSEESNYDWVLFLRKFTDPNLF